MTGQGSTPATPPPSPGEPYSPGGADCSGRREIFSSPALSKGTPIFGDPVCEDGTRSVGTQFSEGPSFSGGILSKLVGTHSSSLGPVLAELDIINRSGLTFEQTLIAQILQGVRNFVIAQDADIADKPIADWDIHDVIRAAKGDRL